MKIRCLKRVGLNVSYFINYLRYIHESKWYTNYNNNSFLKIESLKYVWDKSELFNILFNLFISIGLNSLHVLIRLKKKIATFVIFYISTPTQN